MKRGLGCCAVVVSNSFGCDITGWLVRLVRVAGFGAEVLCVGASGLLQEWVLVWVCFRWNEQRFACCFVVIGVGFFMPSWSLRFGLWWARGEVKRRPWGLGLWCVKQRFVCYLWLLCWFVGLVVVVVVVCWFFPCPCGFLVLVCGGRAAKLSGGPGV